MVAYPDWSLREAVFMTQEQKRENGRKLLVEIRGARLTSVQFVLDYLILGFDEKGALTTLVWPELTSGNRTLSFGMPGYRDELCGFIKRIVETAKISDDEIMEFAFEDGSRIVISLRTYKGLGERAVFTAPKHQLFVW
jgi:hypothetical protein